MCFSLLLTTIVFRTREFKLISYICLITVLQLLKKLRVRLCIKVRYSLYKPSFSKLFCFISMQAFKPLPNYSRKSFRPQINPGCKKLGEFILFEFISAGQLKIICINDSSFYNIKHICGKKSVKKEKNPENSIKKVEITAISLDTILCHAVIMIYQQDKPICCYTYQGAYYTSVEVPGT